MRKEGVLAFGFSPFLQALVRREMGMAFDHAPTGTEKEKIKKKMADLRDAMKLEKDPVHISAKNDACPHTREMLTLFLEVWRETLKEPERAASLNSQLVEERERRLELERELEALREQLERAKMKKKSA